MIQFECCYGVQMLPVSEDIVRPHLPVAVETPILDALIRTVGLLGYALVYASLVSLFMLFNR